jgi:nucleotidyltransferase/DNA polymerase involved in DNA repair
MRSIIHVDMDAFYASVEELDNPFLKTKPIIVGADPKEGQGRGVVAACSYAARKFGVHSAMPISRAWKLCPQGVYLRPRMSRYMEVSRKVMAVFHRFTDLVEPLSIDEAFLDVTGSVALYGEPVEIARNIKRSVREGTGLTASVGLAPNKFLAKIASDLRKPDALVVVRAENIEEFLRNLPVSRLWGVGPKTEQRLTAMRLHTIGQVAALSRESLVRNLGTLGEHLFQLSHGCDERPVVPDADPKSVSNETTFEEDTDDRSLLIRTIHELADEVGRRLRHSQLRARKVVLKLRYENFSTHTKQRSLDAPTQANDEIAGLAITLFNEFLLDRRIRLIGVGTTDLSRVKPENGGQLGLFSDADKAENKTLDNALDEIRSKFGPTSLRRGSQLL